MDINSTADPDQRVAMIVRKAMVDLGIPEIRLAQFSGIPRQTLQRRLAGFTSFTVNELSRIAPLLGKTPADFFIDAAA